MPSLNNNEKGKLIQAIIKELPTKAKNDQENLRKITDFVDTLKK